MLHLNLNSYKIPTDQSINQNKKKKKLGNAEARQYHTEYVPFSKVNRGNAGVAKRQRGWTDE